MRILFLIIGSVLTALLAVKMIQGSKYQSYVENLSDDDFPLKDLYCVGFAWSSGKLFQFKGKMRENLMSQAKLLYDPRFAEYYATIVWTQILSFGHLSIAGGFLLAGIADSALFVAIGIVFAVVFGFYFVNRMNDLLNDRQMDCTAELPEIVSTMALLINSGMMLRTAWRTIADSKEGTVYQLMRSSCEDMDNGMSEIDAIHRFGRLSNSAEIRKFTSALAQSMERGGAELNDFLGRYAIEMWGLKKQIMLQKGEAAASKLLMPTVMIFVGIIIVVIAGALGMLI